MHPIASVRPRRAGLRTRWLAAVRMATVGLALVACGGGEPPPTPAPAGEPAAPPGAAGPAATLRLGRKIVDELDRQRQAARERRAAIDGISDGEGR